MGDAIFTEPKLAYVYDALDPADPTALSTQRWRGNSAPTGCSIGCGTGTFAQVFLADDWPVWRLLSGHLII